MFSPLKTAYRKHLGNLLYPSDSTFTGKVGFLICYLKARNDAITKSNIKAGWRGSGLWPVYLGRPLMNLFVTSATTKAAKTKVLDVPTTPPDRRIKADIRTPTKGRDMRLLANEILHYTPVHIRPVARLRLRKIQKVLNIKNAEIALQHSEIKSLKAKIEIIKPRRRAKVHLAPNSLFANIEKIQQARAAVKGSEEEFNAYKQAYITFEWSIFAYL